MSGTVDAEIDDVGNIYARVGRQNRLPQRSGAAVIHVSHNEGGGSHLLHAHCAQQKSKPDRPPRSPTPARRFRIPKAREDLSGISLCRFHNGGDSCDHSWTELSNPATFFLGEMRPQAYGHERSRPCGKLQLRGAISLKKNGADLWSAPSFRSPSSPSTTRHSRGKTHMDAGATAGR